MSALTRRLRAAAIDATLQVVSSARGVSSTPPVVRDCGVKGVSVSDRCFDHAVTFPREESAKQVFNLAVARL